MSNNTMTLLWSTTNGLMPLGGIFGGLFSGLLADYFGRKNALLLINVLVVISGVLNLLSKLLKVYETILASRFVTGLFSGFFTGVLPIYLFEIAPHNLRGIVGTMNQLNIVIGILFSNIFGLPELFGTSNLWPVLCAIAFGPVLIHGGLFFAVKSPKFLFLQCNDIEGAKNGWPSFCLCLN
jgi:SP family facilitated glucose transporter-like MFS transporter 1